MGGLPRHRICGPGWVMAFAKPSLTVRSRLQRWQQVRTWARLIREAESLWHVGVRELKRLGALELAELLREVPVRQRSRVNRWLTRYAVSTRLPCRDSVDNRG